MKRKQWRPSPSQITLSTAAFIILLMLALGWLSSRRNHFTARVEIADPVIENTTAKSRSNPATHLLPDGEVERTALRVREVSALVIGLTLFAVNEGLARRPIANVEALTGRFIGRGLLPPGVERHEANGVLASGRAVIYVRYRPEPLAVEIVSLGRERLDGPAIIGRIVTGSDENADASLFIARELSNVALPAPFAPNEQIAAMNWSVEPLRQRSLAPEEWAQINAWLRTRGQ
jgi:hypothetical protein